MSVCTFFGHRNCPQTVTPKLRAVLEDLIVNQGVDAFYVGNHGRFDAIVRRVLGELKTVYPQIRYAVVLAYMPQGKNDWMDNSDTMFPEGLENVPPRYAISWRNHWMLKKSDYIITYVIHSWGGAAVFAQKGRKSGKTVINIT